MQVAIRTAGEVGEDTGYQFRGCFLASNTQTFTHEAETAARNDEEEIEATNGRDVEASPECSTVQRQVELYQGEKLHAQRISEPLEKKNRRIVGVQPERLETDKMQNKTSGHKSYCSMVAHLERTRFIE